MRKKDSLYTKKILIGNKNIMIMKKLFLLVLLSIICTAITAQDCKLCGVWNGAFKSEFPSGEKYRVNVEFNIQGSKNFEYTIRPADFGYGERGSNETVVFVDEECNDRLIKYYVKGEDDDWQTGQKFKGREIGNCIMHTYVALELSDRENTLIYRRLGRDYYYYDKYGNYIGKEWKAGTEDSFICILHQLGD